MKIIEANEGKKISFNLSGTWINFDDQIMLNLEKMETDHDIHIDITSDVFGRLSTGIGNYYVAQIDIPARKYNEISSTDLSGDEIVISHESLPFSMENVNLTLFALKEGVFKK